MANVRNRLCATVHSACLRKPCRLGLPKRSHYMQGTRSRTRDLECVSWKGIRCRGGCRMGNGGAETGKYSIVQYFVRKSCIPKCSKKISLIILWSQFHSHLM